MKKGYARDAGLVRVVQTYRFGTSGTIAAECRSDAPMGPEARQPQAAVWVYLDATGLSIGGVHRAEKEQEEGPRLQKRRTYPALSGGHC